MKYRTLNNLSPQGRPRIFFCCAAPDFDRYFEPVTDELLRLMPNAAVWYPAAGEDIADSADFLADLNRMQLFAIPVTSAFLDRSRPDPARTVSFAYAAEHHIPVLPLLQEPGLAELFNEVCGELQCLDRNAAAEDPTALPFEEKLKTFLDSVLMSDELAERVRDAFDAYIFLSYRKKDRADAQRIMRLIHDNEFCRDVAIWYDEFLTPGENFNRAIADAMAKSALFAMVVTPNLLEDPNYVMNTEYPAARSLGIPVLPLAAVPSDEKELQRLYEGIGRTVSANDPAAVGARLKEMLRFTAREEGGSPAHTFLIGIAYLSGIDVEVSRVRGVALIRSAADAGLPEAMEKIADLYETGNGVETDYREAVAWIKKLADILEERTHAAEGEVLTAAPAASSTAAGAASSTAAGAAAGSDAADRAFRSGADECLAEYYRVLKKLRTLLTDLGGVKEAIAVSRRMLSCVNRMKQAGLPDAERLEAEVCRAAGALMDKEGYPDKAYILLRRSLDFYSRRFTEDPSRDDMGLAFAETARIMADQQARAGKPEKAGELYRNAITLTELIARESGRRELLLDALNMYNGLGRILTRLGRHEEALGWYEKALGTAEDFADDSPDGKHILTICLNNTGRALTDLGRYDEALARCRKSFDMINEELAASEILAHRRSLMVTCDILGDVYRKKGSPETAESWFRKSFEAGKQLLRGTNSTEVRFDVTTSCYKIGLVNRDLKRTGGQLEWFGSALKLLTILLKNKRTYETVNLLAHTLRCLGDANRDEDRKEEALRFYLRCVEAREELAEMTGETADRNGLFLTSDHVAVNLAKMGFADEARAVLEKSLARTEETAAATSSVADRDNLMVCCFRLGSLSSVPEEQRGQYLRRFTRLAQTLLAETGSDRYRDLLESQGDGSPALF